MKSHILFKPYIYTVSALGISIAVWQLATVPLNMNLQLLMLILICTAAECYHYYFEDRSTSLSLGGASSFFMLMFFPFSAVVLFCLLSILVQAYRLKKNGLAERLINEKSIYNLAAYVIFNYVTYLGIKWLNISIPSDTLLIGTLVIFQNVFNGVLVCAAQSLAINKSTFDTLFKDLFLYYFYTLICSLMLVYNYYYIGIWAVAGLYSIFIAVQNNTLLKIDNKIKNEKIYRDNLTGVYNREFFIKTVEDKLKNKKQFSIIFLDLDNFKNVNDMYGHLAGDMALQELVANIKGILNGKDYLYRYGGDEFVIVLPDKKEAEAVGNKLYSRKIEIQHEGETIRIKFSTGIYNCTGQETSYMDIIKRVDAAMYESKQKGGNQIVCVDDNEGPGNNINI